MARQQRHFAGDDAEAGPPRAWARAASPAVAAIRAAISAREPRKSKSIGAPVTSSKASSGPSAPAAVAALTRQRDVDQRPGRETALAVEGGAGMGEAIATS